MGLQYKVRGGTQGDTNIYITSAISSCWIRIATFCTYVYSPRVVWREVSDTASNLDCSGSRCLDGPMKSSRPCCGGSRCPATASSPGCGGSRCSGGPRPATASSPGFGGSRCSSGPATASSPGCGGSRCSDDPARASSPGCGGSRCSDDPAMASSPGCGGSRYPDGPATTFCSGRSSWFPPAAVDAKIRPKSAHWLMNKHTRFLGYICGNSAHSPAFLERSFLEIVFLRGFLAVGGAVNSSSSTSRDTATDFRLRGDTRSSGSSAVF